jgi:hypothetical protein
MDRWTAERWVNDVYLESALLRDDGILVVTYHQNQCRLLR